LIDFEKLGAFYLGRRYDSRQDATTGEAVLYDSKDLTTHAAIIGMTGSGKTGLGIGLLEEAALDRVPVIAIDPKGDMGNLLLTFPELRGQDFRPWINERAAADAGQSPDEYAAAQAKLWKKGITDWGQSGERIQALKDSADFAIYTPGSSAGLPVSVLKSFAAPEPALIEDADLYRERIQATATGILALLGVDADPVTSREHILVAQLLDRAWREGRDLDVAGLIAAIQDPPMTRIGVMTVDSFFPPAARFELAMRLNNLLAAPGFEAWMQGPALNARELLHTPAGKPRVSIMSIAHLDDSLRMFFVTMLLNELIAWMRAQPGTSSLRAILYMDEIFGYLPPVSNPPSKPLFLTLLKQARAYGLGLVLATQNPVDLDYKALSNTGTWFIGRLQTERDTARVMEGLQGAADADFDKTAMARTIAGLGKRRFLLHNVHEDEPVVFDTRWVLSYLAGPLTRSQIGRLMEPARAEVADEATAAPRSVPATGAERPLVPPGIDEFFVPSTDAAPVCQPQLLAAAEQLFTSARYGIDDRRELLFAFDFPDGPAGVDWDAGTALDLSAGDLGGDAVPGARFAELPPSALEPKAYPSWERDFKRWLRQNKTMTLYRSKRFRLTSAPGETEGEFRVRIQAAASEQRDLAIAKIRKRYASKLTTLENRLLRANQALEREQEQAAQKTLDTVVSVGSAVLGAVLGRKKLSSATTGKISTAIKSAGTARKESGDVERAEQTAAKVTADIMAMNEALEREILELDTAVDAQAQELEEIVLRAKSTDIGVTAFGLGWLPYTANGEQRLEPAFPRRSHRSPT
jgi:hypothetical protein